MNPSVVPVVLAGVCAFLTLFAPQPLLPMLAEIFHASKVMISLMVTAIDRGRGAGGTGDGTDRGPRGPQTRDRGVGDDIGYCDAADRDLG